MEWGEGGGVPEEKTTNRRSCLEEAVFVVSGPCRRLTDECSPSLTKTLY